MLGLGEEERLGFLKQQEGGGQVRGPEYAENGKGSWAVQQAHKVI